MLSTVQFPLLLTVYILKAISFYHVCMEEVMPCVEVLDISKSLEDSLYVHGRCTVIFDFW